MSKRFFIYIVLFTFILSTRCFCGEEINIDEDIYYIEEVESEITDYLIEDSLEEDSVYIEEYETEPAGEEDNQSEEGLIVDEDASLDFIDGSLHSEKNSQNEKTITAEDVYGPTESTAPTNLLNIPSGSAFNGPYGNQLSGYASELYKSISSKLFESGNNSIVIEYSVENSPYIVKDAIITESESGPVINEDSDGYKEMTLFLQQANQSAMDATSYDFPELFWVRTWDYNVTISIYENPSSKTGYSMYVSSATIIPREIYPGISGSIREFNDSLDLISESLLSPDFSDIDNDGYVSSYEYVLAAHDYICNRCYYDSEGLSTFESNNQNRTASDYRIFSPASVFSRTESAGVVCEGYSRAFKCLCDEVGVECVLVSGLCQGVEHMWNAVCIDDSWYVVDTTLDDREEGISYTYFCVDKGAGKRIQSGDFSGARVFVFKYPSISSSVLNINQQN